MMCWSQNRKLSLENLQLYIKLYGEYNGSVSFNHTVRNMNNNFTAEIFYTGTWVAFQPYQSLLLIIDPVKAMKIGIKYLLLKIY